MDNFKEELRPSLPKVFCFLLDFLQQRIFENLLFRRKQPLNVVFGLLAKRASANCRVLRRLDSDSVEHFVEFLLLEGRLVQLLCAVYDLVFEFC